MVRARSRQAEPGVDVEVHTTSGNVFADLGLPEAEERLAKAELARIVRTTIRHRDWTQRQAAELLGLRQPDVSDLVLGKLARFSRARLERCLVALGYEIRIRVAPRPEGNARPGIAIELVDAL